MEYLNLVHNFLENIWEKLFDVFEQNEKAIFMAGEWQAISKKLCKAKCEQKLNLASAINSTQ